MSYLLESQYYKKSCSSSPDIMYGFTVSDLQASYANETWAPMYEMVVQEYYYQSCGFDIGLTSNCCYQSLDLNLSKNFQSAIPFVITDSIFDSMQKSTNNVSYCALEALSSSSLYGYTHIFVKANGKCISNQFQCTASHFTIFSPDSDCHGSNYTFPISQTKSITPNSELLPSNTLYLYKNTTGTQSFSWVAYTPSKLLITTTGMPGAYSFMAYGASFVISLYLILESSIAVSKNPKLLQPRLTLFSSINWALFIIFKFIFITYPFPDIMLMALESEFMSVCQNFATLAAAINPFHMLVVILQVKKIYQYIIIIVLLAIHFVLAGSNYFYYYRQFPNEWTLAIGAWGNYFVGYVFFLFIWNLFPQAFIAMKILFPSKSTSLKMKLKQLHLVDQNFYLYALMDILLFMAYTILYYIMNFTEILKNDYLYQAMYPYQDLMFLSHNLISIQVSQIVKKAFSNKSMQGESKTPHFPDEDSD